MTVLYDLDHAKYLMTAIQFKHAPRPINSSIYERTKYGDKMKKREPKIVQRLPKHGKRYHLLISYFN